MSTHTDLYLYDFYSWCLSQAALLEARDADGLDWEHLAEEMTILAEKAVQQSNERIAAMVQEHTRMLTEHTAILERIERRHNGH